MNINAYYAGLFILFIAAVSTVTIFNINKKVDHSKKISHLINLLTVFTIPPVWLIYFTYKVYNATKADKA